MYVNSIVKSPPFDALMLSRMCVSRSFIYRPSFAFACERSIRFRLFFICVFHFGTVKRLMTFTSVKTAFPSGRFVLADAQTMLFMPFRSFFFSSSVDFFFAWPQSKLRISWAIVYEGTGGNGEEGEKKRERESEKNTQTRNFSLGGIEMKMDVVPSSLNKHQYKRRSRSPANKKHSRLTKFSER